MSESRRRSSSAALAALTLAATLTLTGCVAPAPNPTDNPLVDLVELIPWARSIADTATAEEITARIDELKTALPTLQLPDATKAEIAAKLEALAADLKSDPTSTAAVAAELRELIDDLKPSVVE